MSYVNCPNCGLSIRIRTSYLALRHCPRCVAHRQVAVQMFVSERPGREQLPQAPDRGDQRSESKRGPRLD